MFDKTKDPNWRQASGLLGAYALKNGAVERTFYGVEITYEGFQKYTVRPCMKLLTAYMCTREEVFPNLHLAHRGAIKMSVDIQKMYKGEMYVITS